MVGMIYCDHSSCSFIHTLGSRVRVGLKLPANRPNRGHRHDGHIVTELPIKLQVAFQTNGLFTLVRIIKRNKSPGRIASLTPEERK